MNKTLFFVLCCAVSLPAFAVKENGLHPCSKFRNIERRGVLKPRNLNPMFEKMAAKEMDKKKIAEVAAGLGSMEIVSKRRRRPAN